MKRKIYLLLTFLLTLTMSVFAFVSCKEEGEAKAEVVSKADIMVVIKVNETEGFATLLDAMTYLKNEGELNFEITGGMVSSIEGKANPADWSKCWMLFTSDAEMSNTALEISWKGETYGSAVVGAGALDVIAGATYVWYYKSF